MRSHGGSFLNMLDMIKHQPTILQITIGYMHLIKSTPLANPYSNILNKTFFAQPFVQGNNYLGCSHKDFST
jgi:hypothetical protein